MTNQTRSLRHPFARPDEGVWVGVAPGVRWLRLPLPFALDHINVWLLDDGPGCTLVDCGLDTAANRAHWQRLLPALDRPLTRIIVTHFHPDHIGLAAWLAEQSGAEVWMTAAEFLTAHAIHAQTPAYGIPAMLELFRSNGLAAERLAALEARGNGYAKGSPHLPASYRRLQHGDELVIGACRWRIIAGYGHSPEHASLYSEEAGLYISGDMVLPRITTNISVFAAEVGDDPLRRYLSSLESLRAIATDPLVLPAHGRPFTGLLARVDALQAHHAERLSLLEAACVEPLTAWQASAVLFRRELDTHQTLFAMGEAMAHLHYLEQVGKIARTKGEDGVVRFQAKASSHEAP